MEPEATDYERKLNAIETAMSDPVFSTARKHAQEFEALLQGLPDVTYEDLSVIVNGLDDEVRSFIGANIKAYGRIYRWSPGNIIESEYIETDDAIFNGFTTIERDDGLGRELVYFMYVPINEEDTFNTDENHTHVSAYAKLNDLILDFHVITPERSEAWLDLTYPELLEDLDVAFLNAQGTEADAVMALKGFDLQAIAGNEDQEMAQACINAYLQARLELDMDIPYSCYVKGPVILYDSDDGQYGIGEMATTRMVEVRALQVLYPQINSGTVTKYPPEFYLNVDIIHEDRRYMNQPAFIPLNSVVSLQSIRSAYYSE